MKLRSYVMYTVPVVVLTLAGGLVRHAVADNKTEPDKDKAAPNMEEMMKKMLEIATPGAGHKVLEALVGDWIVEGKCWMGGPDSPPTATKGTASRKWLLGGRYLQEDFSGDMMGMPFQGMGITAYDNFKKKYVNVWMDTMSTGVFQTDGSADADGKVLTFTGKMDDPSTGEKDKPVKEIVRLVSADKQVFEMHDLTLPKTKVMELTYTRKGAKAE